jgi:16S rRNA (guanine(527)-N(7))-methyltransferase RsmG
MIFDTPEQQEIWNAFIRDCQLSQQQNDQFGIYLQELLSWNERMNLTGMTQMPAIVHYHFRDSLQVGNVVAFKDGDTVCDIGSGAGFPGLPLKIKYPFLKVILIEVNHKKIEFLNFMVERLGLTDVEVCPLDWRTFLRTAKYDVNYFLVRASLDFELLVRMFRSSYRCNQATLIYWASKMWKMGEIEAPFFVKEESYKVGHKNRRLVFFSNNR